MTIDKAQLRALAVAAGGSLWKIHTQEPNTEPPTGASHYNGQYVAVLSEDGGVVCDNADYYSQPVDEAHMNYMASASPAATLALLAEIDRLEEHKQGLIDLRTTHGFNSWAAALVEIDRLRAELAGLRTGYDAQKQVIVALKAESEAYKDIEEALGLPGEVLQIKAHSDPEVRDLELRIDALEKDNSSLRGSCSALGKKLTEATRNLRAAQRTLSWLMFNREISTEGMPKWVLNRFKRLIKYQDKPVE